MEYTLAVYTDTGIQKPTNQDSLCIRRAALPNGDQMVMAAVCDGMGGLQNGELASAEVIRALETWFDGNLELLAAHLDFSDVRCRLTELLHVQNRRIAAYAAAAGVQMGSTLAAILMRGGFWLTVNVGDSRIYQIKNGCAAQITKDQSLVEAEIDRGRITREEAKHHPQRNVLLQCVGVGRELTPAFQEGAVEHGAVYLLCSDGMSHELAQAELAEVLNPWAMGDSRTMQDALINLTERCKARGEADNITGIAVRTAEAVIRKDSRTGSFFNCLRRKPAETKAEAAGISLLESAHLLHTEERI
jgi:serine/threonine protein phosphatase PrpC